MQKKTRKLVLVLLFAAGILVLAVAYMLSPETTGYAAIQQQEAQQQRERELREQMLELRTEQLDEELNEQTPLLPEADDEDDEGDDGREAEASADG